MGKCECRINVLVNSEERDITVAIYNAYGVPFKYVVVSVCGNEELGEFGSLDDAEKHVEELEQFDKERGNPFDDKFMIIVVRKDK